MTGLRPESDRVIEVCLERVVGGQLVDSLTSLVRPSCGTFGNAHVHGIEPHQVEDAPTFAELREPIERLLDGAVLVAHGAAWDVCFLEAELQRAGHPRWIEHYLDTLTLSRRAFALPSHRLSALAAELGITHDDAHRAAGDVRALRGLWSALVRVLLPRSPRDLWHVRVGEKHVRPDLLEAAIEALEGDLPVKIRYRPSHRAPEVLTMRVTGVRTDLDPPRVLGYLLPSHSRRELRADRILAIEGAEPAQASGAGRPA